MIDLLPAEVQATVREFRTCEFTTISKKGAPGTWPVSALWLADEGRFLLTTAIGFAQKAQHIQRNPKVAMLFSNPTGCGLSHPPAVLIQGDATVSDEIMTGVEGVNGLREFWRERIYRRQPASAQISGNPLMRRWMDWYYMRLMIHVTPVRVFWWAQGDFSRPAQTLEANHVG